MRLPNDTQRISIVGRTGSGKTVAAAWHLSHADFQWMPWVVYDFKRDSLLAQIGELEGTEHIGLEEIPRYPGIYFVHPHPDDTEGMKEQMWKIWAQENTGVFIDEGLMVGLYNPAFRSLLAQGRSKHIPMIILSQRPAWLDRFCFSESDYFQAFALNHIKDRQKMMEYVPANLLKPLPKYHSYYHDVGMAETVVMTPVPPIEDTLKVFDSKLTAMRARKRRVII